MSGRYVSLFSGIGGLDLAIEAFFGYEPAAFVEWDASCQRVLGTHWPHVPVFDDITGFGAAALADPSGQRHGSGQDGGAVGRLDGEDAGGSRQRQRPRAVASDRSSATLVADPEHDGRDGSSPVAGAEGERQGWLREPAGADPRHSAIDLVCGGFPCQPASVAGKRAGTDDDRWLWPEFARVVGELRPRHVLVENVAGLLTVNGGRAFSEVIGDLASLGYDATWTSVRASDVGAPHRRERLFLLAHAEGERAGEPHNAAHPIAGGGQARVVPLRRDRGVGFSWGAYEPAIRRWERVMGPAPRPVDEANRLSPDFVAWMMGFPAGWNDGQTRTNRLKQLGNAVVWQQAYAALSMLTATEAVA